MEKLSEVAQWQKSMRGDAFKIIPGGINEKFGILIEGQNLQLRHLDFNPGKTGLDSKTFSYRKLTLGVFSELLGIEPYRPIVPVFVYRPFFGLLPSIFPNLPITTVIFVSSFFVSSLRPNV